MANERRVVVTGLGAITPLGIGTEEYWQGLLAGRSGVNPVIGFDCSAVATRIAAQVKGFAPEAYLDRKETKRMDRFAQFAAAASQMALADSGLAITDENRARVGVFIGSGIGGIQTFEDQHRKLIEGGMGRVSPFFIPMMIANMGTGNVAKMLGAQGPSECAVTACATSTNSLGDAYEVIQRGGADAIVAGGAEAAVTPISMAGFSNMKAMSTRNDDPEHASRPFDIGRDGFILGEGSGILILEELTTAQARGAHIYAEIIGYGMSNDAYDMVHPAPEGAGAARAMTAALKSACLPPSAVGYINAPRNQHPGRGCSGSAGHQIRLRQPCPPLGCFLHQVHDRPSARRSRRNRSHRRRAGPPARHSAPHDELGNPRPRMRPGLRPQQSPRTTGRYRPVQFLRLRRPQRHPRLQTLVG